MAPNYFLRYRLSKQHRPGELGTRYGTVTFTLTQVGFFPGGNGTRRCSRVAWSLLLAALGGAMMALGLADGRQGVAADFGPEQPTCVDTLNRADDFQEASHWSDACATDGEQPRTENSYESYAPCKDETAATGTEEDQFESRYGNQENADDEYDEYESNYGYKYEDASTGESDEAVED